MASGALNIPKRLCRFGDCQEIARSKGYCHKHYQRLLRHDDPSIVLDNQARPITALHPDRLCVAPGCENEQATRQLCRKHYQRWRRHGSVDADSKPGRPLSRDYVALNLCKDEGCTNLARSHGQCDRHFGQNKFCREVDCPNLHLKGNPYCGTHYRPEPEDTCMKPLDAGEFCGNPTYRGQHCRKHYHETIKEDQEAVRRDIAREEMFRSQGYDEGMRTTWKGKPRK